MLRKIMATSDFGLSNGVKVDSVVIARYYGITRYGKIIEIDNNTTRSIARGNVLVQHFDTEKLPSTQWYWGINVEVLNSENYEQQQRKLQSELEELNKAALLIIKNFVPPK